MAVRRYVSSLVRRVIAREVHDELVRQRASEPTPEPPPPEPEPGPDPAVEALRERADKLEKKLSMAMGAIQAASAQIVQLRQEVELATNTAHQAMQKAVSAAATAEAATEGVTLLEAVVTAPPQAT